jgi:hypothetical protein
LNDTTIGFDQAEDEMLSYEVSDEALEVAAGTGRENARNYTHFFCTFFDNCPGP